MAVGFYFQILKRCFYILEIYFFLSIDIAFEIPKTELSVVENLGRLFALF